MLLAIALTFIFSAKESIYKALYPIVKNQFYFQDARIEAIDVANTSFIYSLCTDLGGEFSKGYKGEGRYHWDETYIHTAVLVSH